MLGLITLTLAILHLSNPSAQACLGSNECGECEHCMGGSCMANCMMCPSQYCDGCNCISQCSTDDECDDQRCNEGACVECIEDSDCADDEHCMGTSCMNNAEHEGHAMYFTTSTLVTLLFKGWTTNATWEYILSCLACFAFGCIAIELKVQRIKVEKFLIPRANKSNALKHHAGHNVLRAAMVFVVYSMDYLLMLIIMTFNLGIFLSVVFGVSFMFLVRGHHMTHRTVRPPAVTASAQVSP